ncbi:MAG: DUF4358 domain-containing protein [Clostridiales bacterium]|nr:DUF4358 domain-containing protein [Clostridiales bacterium]
MKIKTILVSVLSAAFLLTACGSEPQETETDTPTETEATAETTLSSGDLYASLTESGLFSELTPLDGDYMLNLFGTDISAYTDYAAGEALDVMNADTIVIFNTDSADLAAEAAEKLKTYRQRKIDELTDYNPSQLPKTEAAEVKTKDSFTYLLICDDTDAAEELLEGLIK